MTCMGLIFLTALFGVVLGENSHCGVNITLPDTIFSSRTLYDAVRGSQIPKTEIKGCKPVAMWVLLRNGITNPTAQELNQFALLAELRDSILDNHDKWQSDELCTPDLEGLRSWTLSMDTDRADRLASAGHKAIIEFAERLSGQFGDILSYKNPRHHSVKHTTVLNTKETADIFTSTLYKQSVPLSPVGDLQDWLQQKCPSWVRKEQEANEKANLYRESEAMKNVVQNVARRFGFNRLDFNLIRDAYKLCTFERALNSNSPWCSIFTQDELEAFEFEEDLVSYHAHGHGNPMAAKVGCKILSTIVQNLSVYKYNEKVNVQVLREVGFRGFLVALGLLKDSQHLSHENQEEYRLWKNSHITPFSANFVVVLNECLSGKVNTVSLYLNEKPLPLPWCNNSHVCNFASFKQKIANVISPNYCNYNFCTA